MATPRFEKLSKGGRVALLSTVTLVLCVALALVAEGAVRVRQWMKYGYLARVEDTFVSDPESGLRLLIPNKVTGGIAINSLGFRGPELAVPKPAGTVRLAFVGASTTYCAEVTDNEHVWPHLVTSALGKARPDVHFDYVNAGVPGYGVSTSLTHLNYKVAPLDPDVIVIYHATNDLSQNSLDLARARGVAQKRTEQTLSWLSQYSLLAYLVEKNLLINEQQQHAADQQAKLAFDVEEVTAPFKADLLALVRRSQEVAPVVVLATFSFRLRHGQTPEEQAAAAATSLYYMPYMSIDGLLRAADAYNVAIREVAAETGAVVVEVAEEIPGDALHFVDSVHFTDQGSAAIADLVTRRLLEPATLDLVIHGHATHER